MVDMIDRDALKKAMCRSCGYHGDCDYPGTYCWDMQTINEQPVVGYDKADLKRAYNTGYYQGQREAEKKKSAAPWSIDKAALLAAINDCPEGDAFREELNRVIELGVRLIESQIKDGKIPDWMKEANK